MYTESEKYYCPSNGDISVYRNYINDMSLQDPPEVFGLHDNANIVYQKDQSELIITTVLNIQPRVSTAAGGLSPDQLVIAKATEIEEKVPEDLALEMGKKELFKLINNLLQSLTTVLKQEVEKFNRLLGVMRSTLKDLVDAIKGLIIMSDDLDKMYVSL